MPRCQFSLVAGAEICPYLSLEYIPQHALAVSTSRSLFVTFNALFLLSLVAFADLPSSPVGRQTFCPVTHLLLLKQAYDFYIS
jgi:hypothetical protein